MTTDILDGLSSSQQTLIKGLRNYREFEPGEILFKEGDEADSMFTVLSGCVEIYRETEDGIVSIAKLERPETFGEMGLLTKVGRTASARALVPTLTFELPRNIVEVLSDTGDFDAAIKLLENVICILSDRLRAENKRGYTVPGTRMIEKTDEIRKDINYGLHIIESNLPKDLSNTIAYQEKMPSDLFLCQEGDPADGFFFLHEGRVEVLMDDAEGELRHISFIDGPTITGELGFFGKRDRNATLRSYTNIVYSKFPASHFNKIKTLKPKDALEILFSATQMAVYLLMKDRS